MGIDPLDVMFRIHKRIGVELKREEGLFLIDTAGSLHQVICAKLNGHQPLVPDVFAIQARIMQCLKQFPAYRWWRYMLHNGRLGKIVPQTQLASSWAGLAECLKCELPELVLDSRGNLAIPDPVSELIGLTRWLIQKRPRIVPPIREESFGPPMPQRSKWTDAEVWEILKEILRDSLGVRLDEIRPDSRLIEDLGME